jgi:signal transduction histidine kinase
VALVVLSVLPSYRPRDLLVCLLSLTAGAVLVLAAELASFDQAGRARGVPDLGADGPLVTKRGHPGPNQWSDPAMVSVDRWLAHWPGVAGVSAVSWWAARVGAAGLLAALGLRALGLSLPPALAAAVVVVLAIVSLVPGRRHLVHAALGIVAATGLVVTVGGLVALLQGRLTMPLLPAGPWLPSAHMGGTATVDAATTIVLVCLAAVSLPAVIPATSAGSGGRARSTTVLVWGSVGTAVVSWGFAVPVLLRVGGLSVVSVVLEGSPGALLSALRTVVGPVADGHAGSLAGGLLFAACVAGAFGALAGGTGLAETAVGAAWAGRAGRHGLSAPTLGAPGAPQKQSPARTVPALALAGVAAASGAAAAAVALLGLRGWLVVALGGLATGALALTTLAPPVLRQCQRVPSAVRVCVAVAWALVVTLAIGSAGPGPLALDGIASLAGALALGWRGPHIKAWWRTRHLAIPWGTAATALVTSSAVIALEVLPVGDGLPGWGAWRGLAVLAMGAGIVVLAVFPATSRLRAEHLGTAAATLAEKTLPALAKALEAIACGDAARVPTAGLSELKAATRPLEGELAAYRASGEMHALTKALVEASRQVQRLAVGVEAVARLDGRRLEELVEERTTALSNVNRHLVDSQWRRRQLLDRTVRVAEGERARIAANLHDGPIQRLATLGLILDRCRLRMDRDDRAGALDLVKRARNELSNEIQSLRQMMSELRPPILDEGGLEAAIKDHLSAWSQGTGIEGRFEGALRPTLSTNSETVIYRVVQEALANVAKHARASLTTVTLAAAGHGVQVVVRDNGRGFASLSQPDLLRGGHFGLVVMRERVELAAGKFEVQSAPRTGTEVIMWLPTNSTSEPVEVA